MWVVNLFVKREVAGKVMHIAGIQLQELILGKRVKNLRFSSSPILTDSMCIVGKIPGKSQAYRSTPPKREKNNNSRFLVL